MSYATLVDLQDFLPKYDINNLSKPTAAQCTKYLSRTSSIIDGILAGQGYSIPVTGAESVEILRHLNLVYAGYWTTRIMFPSNTNGMVVELRDELRELMMLLRAEELLLPDASSAPDNVAINATALGDPTDLCWYETHPFITRVKQY